MDSDSDDGRSDAGADRGAVQLGFVVEESAEPLPELFTTMDDFPNKSGGRPASRANDHSAALRRFKLFRSQLPRDNSIYTPDGEFKIQPADEFCKVCGLKGSLRCSKCKNVRYCGKTHAVLDWDLGQHKSLCGAESEPASAVDAVRMKALFPEFELEDDDEPDAASALPKRDDLVDAIGSVGVSDPEEDEMLAMEEETKVDVDSAFLKFQKRVALAPEQVLSGADAKSRAVVKIMPQMLNNLGLDHSDKDALDWGTVLLYTCAADCKPSGAALAREFVAVQHFSQAGLGDSVREALRKRQEQAKQE
nr:Programmed cell death protein 2 [Polyrhizophydium stewartii]